jgi:GntR family transcriptional regulator/MocR family aminotransferase
LQNFISGFSSFISSINTRIFEAKYELNWATFEELHPIHEFSNGNALPKRKSLISKWNQNKKTRYSVFENQLCNYLNAKGTSKHKTHQHHKNTEMSLYIISQLKTLVWLGIL